jgi:hypothetical protein
MSELDKFADIFRRRLEGVKQAQLRFVVCRSVDWSEKTMTAVGVSDDVPYEGVQLGFGFVDIKPKEDTVCLIGILEGKEALTFLINAEDVELVEVKPGTIEINAGTLGGLVKAGALTRQLNKIENDVNNLKNAFSSWVAVPNDGGAALKTAVATWSSQRIGVTQQENIENEKIKQ